MKIATVAFIMVVFCLLFNSCNKKECEEAEGGYFFEIPASVTPRQDTFRIGDTINFVSDFGNSVSEKTTGRNYQLIDFNFYPKTWINRIDASDQHGGLDDFNIIIDSSYDYFEQRYSEGSVLLAGAYKYKDGRYSLGFKLVPKVKGFYYFSHNSSLWERNGADQDFDGKCKNVPLREILVYVNERDDNNIDLLRNSADPFYNEWIFNDPQRNFYEEGAYVFYVVD